MRDGVGSGSLSRATPNATLSAVLFLLKRTLFYAGKPCAPTIDWTRMTNLGIYAALVGIRVSTGIRLELETVENPIGLESATRLVPRGKVQASSGKLK